MMNKDNEIVVEYMSDAPEFPLRQGCIDDCGWDMKTACDVVIPSHKRVDIPSDIKVHIPNGYFARILARSSTSKRDLLVLPGIIDAGFQGQLYALCWNMSDVDVIVNKGERIAQLIFQRVVKINFKKVDKFGPSIRGAKGFGSTGA